MGAFEDLACGSIALPLESSCSMLKRNASSSSSIDSLFTASTCNSDDMSVIGNEIVCRSDSIEYPFPSCINIERIDCREKNSKIDDLIRIKSTMISECFKLVSAYY